MKAKVWVLLITQMPEEPAEVEGVYDSHEKAKQRERDLILKIGRWGGYSEIIEKEVERDVILKINRWLGYSEIIEKEIQ